MLLTSLISFRRDQVQCIADSIADGSCKVINDPTAGQPTKVRTCRKFLLFILAGMLRDCAFSPIENFYTSARDIVVRRGYSSGTGSVSPFGIRPYDMRSCVTVLGPSKLIN